MRSVPESEKPLVPDPSVAWNKAQVYLDRVSDALHDLEEGGGVLEAARIGGWKPSKLDKAAEALKLTRDAIDGERGWWSGGPVRGLRRTPLHGREWCFFTAMATK